MNEQSQPQNRYRSYAVHTAQQAMEQADRHLVSVEVTMPHVQKYGKATTMTLLYGAKFPVRPGMKVLCPPTRLNGKWTIGRVVAIDEPGSYTGKIKYVARLGRRK